MFYSSYLICYLAKVNDRLAVWRLLGFLEKKIKESCKSERPLSGLETTPQVLQAQRHQGLAKVNDRLAVWRQRRLRGMLKGMWVRHITRLGGV